MHKMRFNMKVVFDGEPGVDEGGLLTEMFTQFFDTVLDPSYGLFEAAGGGGGGSGQDKQNNGNNGNNNRNNSNSFEDGEEDRDRRDVSRSMSFDEDGEVKQVNLVVLPSPFGGSFERLKKLRAFGRAVVKALYEGKRIGQRLCSSVFKFLAHSEQTDNSYKSSTENKNHIGESSTLNSASGDSGEFLNFGANTPTMRDLQVSKPLSTFNMSTEIWIAVSLYLYISISLYRSYLSQC